MALKLSGLFHTNVSDMQRGEGATSAKTGTDAGKVQQSETSIKELTPGRAIRGEIVGKNGQEIQIRIAKDVVINAKMEQDIQASKGQNVTFEVRSNVSGVISLRPLFQNMSQENNALKALVQAGIESDAKSIQMVSSMMQEGMSIGKDALQGMYKALMGIQEADVAHAVQMNRLQIPVTPENLEQFAAYKNYEHQLLSSFSQIAEEIPGAVSQLFSEGNIQEGTLLIDKLLTVFNEEGAETGMPSQQPVGEEGKVMAQGRPVPAESVGRNGETGAANRIADLVLTENTDDEIGQMQEQPEAKAVQNMPEAELTKEASQQRPVPDGQTEERAASGKNLAELTKQTEHTDKAEILPSGGDREQLAALIKDAGGSREAISLLQSGQMEKEELYQLVRSLTKSADTPEKQNAVKELFVSEGFQKIFKEKIGNQWTLKAPEHLEKETISKLYERLNEQTRQLTQALSQVAKADTPLFRSIQNVRENVDFMNQLNQLYTYVQLPLKLSSSNAHGDLYVYTNKKNLANKDGNISAFLHLDMEHLGMVDVYVAMEQGKISTNFYLEDEESLELLENNMDTLTKRLTEKGYRAECNVMLKEQAGNAMEELIATDKNISIISEQSFDVRA